MPRALDGHLYSAVHGDLDVAERGLKLMCAALKRIDLHSPIPAIAYGANNSRIHALSNLKDTLTEQGKTDEAKVHRAEMTAARLRQSQKRADKEWRGIPRHPGGLEPSKLTATGEVAAEAAYASTSRAPAQTAPAPAQPAASSASPTSGASAPAPADNLTEELKNLFSGSVWGGF
jgi:hypothetical protein